MSHCGQKEHRLDQEWGLHPGEVSRVLGELLAIAGVDIAFGQPSRTVQELLLLEVNDNTIRKQTQQLGEKQAQVKRNGSRRAKISLAAGTGTNQSEGPARLYGSLDGVQGLAGRNGES